MRILSIVISIPQLYTWKKTMKTLAFVIGYDTIQYIYVRSKADAMASLI